MLQHDLCLPDELRLLLGARLPRTFLHSLARGTAFLKKHRHSGIVAVGDFTFEILTRAGLRPHAVVVDCKERRLDRECPSLEGYTVLRVANPPAHISREAFAAVCTAASSEGVAVLVDGEEDLLALPAIYCSPVGTLVVYGIPGFSSAVVKVDADNKTRALQIMHMLRPCRGESSR
jgi:hypothetical protein